MKGEMQNIARVTVTLLSDSRSDLEEIVPLERDQQRRIKVCLANQELTNFFTAGDLGDEESGQVPEDATGEQMRQAREELFSNCRG